MEYYTDDITRMPAKVIWRTVWRTAPLLCVPLFLLFLLQRCIGWRPPANHGIAKAASPPEVSPEQVPPPVREAMHPYLEAFSHLGFQHVFYLKPPYIGRKQGYSAVLLHPGGFIFATVVWICISRGPQTRSSVLYSCHSLDSKGTQMTTGPIASEHRNPELIPPFHDLLPLPLGTPPAEVIAAHQSRIQSVQGLVRLDRESLAKQMLNSMNKLIDYMVDRGIYVPISHAEIVRLTKG